MVELHTLVLVLFRFLRLYVHRLFVRLVCNHISTCTIFGCGSAQYAGIVIRAESSVMVALRTLVLVLFRFLRLYVHRLFIHLVCNHISTCTIFGCGSAQYAGIVICAESSVMAALSTLVL